MPDRPDLSDLIMRCYVELVTEKSKEKGFNKGQFAQAAWPEDTPKASRTRWLHIRTITPNINKPQGVLLSDAHKMAAALGESFSLLILRAEDRALQKIKQLEEVSTKRSTNKKTSAYENKA